MTRKNATSRVSFTGGSVADTDRRDGCSSVDAATRRAQCWIGNRGGLQEFRLGSRPFWILGHLAGTRGRLEAEEYGVAFLREPRRFQDWLGASP